MRQALATMLGLVILALSGSGFAAPAAQSGTLGIAFEIRNGAVMVAVVNPEFHGSDNNIQQGDQVLAVGRVGGRMVELRNTPVDQFMQQLNGRVGETVNIRLSRPLGAGSEVRTISINFVAPTAPWGPEAGPPGQAGLPAWLEPRLAPMRSFGSYLVGLPPDYADSGKRYPIVVLLHGGGGSEAISQIIWRLGREGVIYVVPRAPQVATSFFVQTRRPSFSGFPDNAGGRSSAISQQARQNNIDWVFSTVDEVRANYRAAEGKVALYGFSQGGGIAGAAAFTQPQRVSSVFFQEASAGFDDLMTPERVAALKRENISFEILQGASSAAGRGGSNPLAERLRTAELPYVLHTIPGGHEINREMTEVARLWVDRFRIR